MKKKSIGTLLISICLFLGTVVPALAADGVCGAALFWTFEDGVLEISGTGEMYAYTADSMPWYALKNEITTVVLEKGVTSVGDGAFAYCGNLQAVTLPEGLQSVGHGAFAGCTALSGIRLPDSVYYLGSYVFAGCAALTDITLPAGVDAIGSYAFYKCTGLRRLQMAGGVSEIGYAAFSGCSELEEVAFGDGLYTVGTHAFSYCDSLTEVILPDGVTAVGDYAFYHCRSLHRAKMRGAASIGAYAFAECAALNDITVGSISELSPFVFAGCSALGQMTLPDSVQTVGSSAFVGSGVKNVSLPAGMRTVDGYAFLNCDLLTDIYFRDSADKWGGLTIAAAGNSDLTDAALHFAGKTPEGAAMSIKTVEKDAVTVEAVGCGDMLTGIVLLASYQNGVLQSLQSKEAAPQVTFALKNAGQYDLTCLYWRDLSQMAPQAESAAFTSPTVLRPAVPEVPSNATEEAKNLQFEAFTLQYTKQGSDKLGLRFVVRYSDLPFTPTETNVVGLPVEGKVFERDLEIPFFSELIGYEPRDSECCVLIMQSKPQLANYLSTVNNPDYYWDAVVKPLS